MEDARGYAEERGLENYYCRLVKEIPPIAIWDEVIDVGVVASDLDKV